MALLLFDGFEWDGFSHRWGNTPDIQSGVVRANTGDRCAQLDIGHTLAGVVDTADNVLVIGMAFRSDENFNTLSSGYKIMNLEAADGTGLWHMNPWSESWEFTVNGGPDISVTRSLGVWYYLELKMDFAAGTMEVRVDGTVVGSSSGITWPTPGASKTLRLVGTSTVTDEQYVDDLYILDGAGTANNDYLGDVRILPLVTAADGVNTGWTPDTGTDHEARVDHDFGDDFASGYIEALSTGLKDSFTVQALAGAPSGFQPYALEVSAGLLDPGGSPIDVDGVVRVGGIDYDAGDQQAPNGTAGRRHWMWVDNPATGSPWTQAEIEAAEIGVHTKA